MSLMVNHNIASLNTWRLLQKTDQGIARSMEKLSSGMRINRAADDPAGLVITEKMRSQLFGLKSAMTNITKATNMISTAESALDKVNALLLKMRALAIDSANLAVNDADMLQANQQEFDEALDSIDSIAANTKFGSKKLLDVTTGTSPPAFSSGPVSNVSGLQDGVLYSIENELDGTLFFDEVLTSGTYLRFSNKGDVAGDYVAADADMNFLAGVSFTYDGSLAVGDSHSFTYTSPGAAVDAEVWVFQVGPNGGQQVTVEPQNMRVDQLAVDGSMNLGQLRSGGLYTGGFMAESSLTDAERADSINEGLTVIDTASAEVGSYRGKLGAIQSDNLEVQLDVAMTAYENMQASESAVRDTDMAFEMSNFTKLQIMLQAGTAMLSQANQLPNGLLTLLRQ